MVNTNLSQKETQIYNAVFGMAYGDAWGKNTEFKKFSQIALLAPAFPYGHALITDDTQMSLYAMKAITEHYDTVSELEDDVNRMKFKLKSV